MSIEPSKKAVNFNFRGQNSFQENMKKNNIYEKPSSRKKSNKKVTYRSKKIFFLIIPSQFFSLDVGYADLQ